MQTQSLSLAKPLFSVVIAAYNAEATILASLVSLTEQSLGDWEAILVDDGSQDATLALALQAAYADPRIRVISQPNSGPSRARNRGIKEARGRYIAFLDADDLWTPETLALHAAHFEDAPLVSVSFGQVAFFEQEAADSRSRSKVPAKPLAILDLLKENRVCTTSNLVARREAFVVTGLFREDMSFGEDRAWLVQACAAGLTIRGLPALTVYYRTSTGGLSANLRKMHDGWRESLAIAQAAPFGPDSKSCRRAEAVYLRYLARRALRVSCGGWIALGYALKGFCRAPGSFLAEPRRGLAVLAAAFAAPFLPRGLNRRLFAK